MPSPNTKTPRRVMLLVEADLPTGSTAAEFRRYALDAIKSSIGGLRPEERLFDLDRNSVTGRVLRGEIAQLLDKVKNPIMRRQVIFALRNNQLMKTWFE